MIELSPCPTCHRHVRGTACPFCDSAVVARQPHGSLGRVSRAMVFASATLAAAACGGSQKKATNDVDSEKADQQEQEERRHPDRPCMEPDPAAVAEARKKVEDAKTDDEKRAAEDELHRVDTPVCAPYGAPPARHRVV